MSVFQPAQYEDLRDLQAACRQLGAEVAIIGAMA